ncbi:MAG: hypothetical protein ACLUGM_12810, partial [Coprococcus phoceensis]
KRDSRQSQKKRIIHAFVVVEKYLVSTEENRFEYSPVPKRCQEIRQIKIGGAIQPFFTVFWRENHKKYEIKRD